MELSAEWKLSYMHINFSSIVILQELWKRNGDCWTC